FGSQQKYAEWKWKQGPFQFSSVGTQAMLAEVTPSASAKVSDPHIRTTAAGVAVAPQRAAAPPQEPAANRQPLRSAAKPELFPEKYPAVIRKVENNPAFVIS